MPSLSRSLEQALHRAIKLASDRHHEYATPEHLLLALMDDTDAAQVMKACNVDLDALRTRTMQMVAVYQSLLREGAGLNGPHCGPKTRSSSFRSRRPGASRPIMARRRSWST